MRICVLSDNESVYCLISGDISSEVSVEGLYSNRWISRVEPYRGYCARSCNETLRGTSQGELQF